MRLLSVLLCCAVAACSTPQAAPAPTPAAPSAVSSPSSDALEPFYSQLLQWEPCDGGFECATADVPLDYDDPTGPTIEVAVLRAAATDPDARIGTLFVNPGGPGSPGTTYATSADQIVSPTIRAAFDVVGFDPRGVGRSTPVECVSDPELDEALGSGDPTPDTPAEVQALVDGVSEFNSACSASSPGLLPHVGTVDVARDLDILRAGVGEDRLYYLGKSYATSIGIEYLRQFPERTGRVVLDGVVDPSLTAEEFALGQAGGFELALSRFADACTQQRCSLGETPEDVVAAVDEVLAAADDSPLPTTGRPLTEGLAFYGILFPLYLPAEQGYATLERALSSALNGDGTALLAIADAYLQRQPDGSYPTNQWEVIPAVSCLDRPSDATPSDVEALLPAFREASPTFGDSLAWGVLGCTDWPVSSDGLPAPVTAPTAPPVLVLGTTGDPATPYEWAVAVADQLETATLVTFDGTSHLAYRKGSACVDEAVHAYLLDGSIPEDETRCA
jgi:pimeloyl-ACP methyl ester carboxylesterase